MRKKVCYLVVLSLLCYLSACAKMDGAMTSPAAQVPSPVVPLTTTATPDQPAIAPSPVCPPASGVGTIAPEVSIVSITFLVNGLAQVVHPEDGLQTTPGDQIQVSQVILCAGPFPGEGGNACIDFAPLGPDGQEVMAEHQGTHPVAVTQGLITIPGLDFSWTTRAGWSGLSAVVNHWTPEKTDDPGCASGLCERDDRILIDFE